MLGQVNIGLYCCHHIGTETVSRLSFCISALVLVQPGLLWATIFSKVLPLDVCDAKILDAALDAAQDAAHDAAHDAALNAYQVGQDHKLSDWWSMTTMT